MKITTLVILSLSLAAMAKKDLKQTNVNTAPLDSLVAHLPGVGDSIAARMVAARPFADCKDLAHVKGLGKAKLAKVCPLATF